MNIITKNVLIRNPQNCSSHIVLLGAGASRAAFPKGDAYGKSLPLMNDFVSTLDLTTLLKRYDIDPAGNFETIYSTIKDNKLRQTLEKYIYDYFINLQLPDTATLYDRLLLSLREKDAIFTFNWDPFLFDAHERNREIAKLPQIFFLHGNVRIGSCHGQWGKKNLFCPICNEQFRNVPLLYPVKEKDYFKSNEYIASSWKEAKELFSKAFTMTVIGYSAPKSDIEAVNLLKTAWFSQYKREIERIEIIDKKYKNNTQEQENKNILFQRWQSFTPNYHLNLESSVKQSRLFRWPRRTCESLNYPITKGGVCEDFPLPITNDLKKLQQYIKNIASHEN